jgi:hypothetical protein
MLVPARIAEWYATQQTIYRAASLDLCGQDAWLHLLYRNNPEETERLSDGINGLNTRGLSLQTLAPQYSLLFLSDTTVSSTFKLVFAMDYALIWDPVKWALDFAMKEHLAAERPRQELRARIPLNEET